MIVSYLFYFAPLLLQGLGAICLLFAGLALGLTRPLPLVLLYLLILLSFTASTYGAIDAGATIYTRGSGVLYFGFMVWGMWGLGILVWFYGKFAHQPAVFTNLKVPALLMSLLFTGHIVVGIYAGVPLENILGSTGFINIIQAIIFAWLLLKVVQSESDLNWLKKLLLVIGPVRALFGLGRWAFFGGDPANAYSNIEKMAVNLTFFDICDSLLAVVVLIYCLRMLLDSWQTASVKTRLLLISIVLLEFACIVLSYRRTAWGGLILALIYFVLCNPPKVKALLLLISPLGLIPVALLAGNRLSKISPSGSLWESFIYDLLPKSASSAESSRALQLKWALETVWDYPVFGVGSWGSYRSAGALAQSGFDVADYIHSGVVQILLKTGFVGFSICAAIIGLFIQFVYPLRKKLASQDRWLLDAAIAGLLFMLPDFLIGTPVQQYRTMLLLGFLLILPYLIASAAQKGKP